MNKRVLITGGGGFLGQWLVKGLTEDGWRVRILTQKKKGLAKSLGIEVVTGNILDKKRVRVAVKGCERVFHLAALTGRRDTESNPKLCLDVNIGGTKLLYEESVKAQVKKVVFFSSLEVTRDPLSTYAISKLAGEAYAKAITRATNTAYLVLRLGNIFGVGQTNEYVIPMFIEKMLKGEEIEVHRGEKRYFVPVKLAIDEVLELADREENECLTVVAGQKELGIEELVDILKGVMKGRKKGGKMEEALKELTEEIYSRTK